MISEQYVSYEVAKLLKEKWFDEHTHERYGLYVNGQFYRLPNDRGLLIDPDVDVVYTTFTIQMVMQWLREVHHIHVCPEYKAFFQERPKKIYHHWCNKIIGIDRYFKQGIQDLDKLDSDYFYFHDCKTYHDSYEEACEECIEYTLRNLIEGGVGKE